MNSLLGIIPAKGHSNRLPGKNMLKIDGETLVLRAIRCAADAEIFDDIVVSTDSLEIYHAVDFQFVRRHLRSDAFSVDGVESAAVVMDVLATTSQQHADLYDNFCLLNPSSPCRTPEQLKQAWFFFNTGKMDSLGSAEKEMNKHNGDFLFWKTIPFLRYISRSIIAPTTAPIYTNGIDINTEADYLKAKKVLE